jgi:hypothetical protein
MSQSLPPEPVKSGPTQPPKVFRVMKSDPKDHLPVVGTNSSPELGARPGIDVTVDPDGHVVLNQSGMSVAPGWRDLDFHCIPRRLRPLVPGAAGSNNTSCYSLGIGPFQRGAVATGLELIPDEGPPPIVHGVLAPLEVVPLADYQAHLANTRASWQIDET